MVASSGGASPTGTAGAMTPKGTGKRSVSADSPGFPGGHRAPETDDPLLVSIASKQSALVQQVITVTCYIPSSSVGAVIGRRGSTIAQIQRQAQQVGTSNGPVRLSIVGHQSEIVANGDSPEGSMEQLQHQLSPTQTHSKPQQANTPLQSTTASVPYTYSELDWSSPSWTPVVIRADPCAAFTAAQLLRGKVGHIDDVVVDVPLSRAKHAAVVGRRGYVLANLSADTNVRIMVPRRELRHDVIQLEGDLDNVKLCLQKVLVISSDPAAGNKKKVTGNGVTNTPISTTTINRQPPEKTEEPLMVVVTMSALPSQTKLRTIGRKTDTIIKKKKVDDSSWDLTISGSAPENVQTAASILKKWNEDSGKPGGAPNSSSNASTTNSSGNAGATPSRSRGPRRPRTNKGRGGNHRSNNNKGGKPVDSPSS